MSRTVFTLTLLFASATHASAGPDRLFVRKPKVDDDRARALVETLKGDADEKKRKAAADELGGANVRNCPEVTPALVAALRKDASAAVRAEAADALRYLGEPHSQAGVALQTATESDPSPLVRLAAKRTLWDYHLSGYRPPKAADGTAAQTVEPPLASPAAPRPVVAFVPAPPVPVAPQVPPVAAVPVPQQLPQVAPQLGPRLFLPNVLPGPRAAVRSALNVGPAPPVLNLTTEPPVAKRAPVPPVTVPVPVPNAEPPLRLPFPAPPVESLSPGPAPTLPPFIPDLPPIVTPPGK